MADSALQKCAECEKLVSFYNARRCTWCGGKGSAIDPFYCITCTEEGCTTRANCQQHRTSCWNRHINPTSATAAKHQMVDPLPQLFVEVVTHSERDTQKLRQLHEQDENARWFKIRRDEAGRPDLYIYDRFMEECDRSRTGNRETTHHYPSFVSFIGDTSVGKSTLVRAMLVLGRLYSLNPNPADQSLSDEAAIDELRKISAEGEYGPVTRSGNIDHLTDPTTSGVHLYRDVGRAMFKELRRASTNSGRVSQYPMLLVDCEGFRAGEAMTNAERMESEPGLDSRGRILSDSSTLGNHRGRSVSRRKNLLSQIPVIAPCYGSSGKDGVDLFYARFLYAISDVIVFVTKEDQRIQFELTRILEWASAAVLKSVNHPSRKTLIVVRNMPSFHDPALYKRDGLEEIYLRGHPDLWDDSPILREFVEGYNRKEEKFERRITSNRRLYEVLFYKITCCYIPRAKEVSGQPHELLDQYKDLRRLVELSVRDGNKLRERSFMKYNVPTLSHILNRAFEHFSSSEDPLDFYLAARGDNPNPKSMPEHLANFLRHTSEYSVNNGSINDMVFDVVTISLVIYTHRHVELVTSPDDIFDRDLHKICDEGINAYLNKFESCSYIFPGGAPCVSRLETLHSHHTSSGGQTTQGPFLRERSWTNDGRTFWISEIRDRFSKYYDGFFREEDDRLNNAAEPREYRIREERKAVHTKHHKVWGSIRSNKTCLSCLQAVPDHVLGCGHSYCPRCIQELGTPSSNFECAWVMFGCVLCRSAEQELPHLVKLRARCAGARVLTLDGGGIRGIVELALLRSIDEAIGLKIPIRDMVDLVVGTSTGGIIALAIAMSSSSVEELTTFFTKAARQTFSENRTGSFFSKIDPSHTAAKTLMFFQLYESVFKREPLEKALKGFFGEEASLFAPARKGLRPHSTTRVAVTAAKDSGQTDCLIASYNRPVIDDWGNFDREDSESKDMKIWEAGLATSAAPFYLPPFVKEETKTDYVDGAVYANCPAHVAYEETLKLWPDNGSGLDFLLSLGTGLQKQRGDKTPTAVKFGGFAPIRAMFERQLNSHKSWDQFENGPAGSHIRCRLHRLNPPLDGEHVALYDHHKIADLVEVVETWTKLPEIAEEIDDIANILIANLFFFEPDEKASSVSRNLLGDHSYDILAGSIRCRLGHETVPLRNLLSKRVESFWYAEASSADTKKLSNLPNPRWTLVRSASAVVPSQMTIQEHEVKKFRLNHTFQVKNGSHSFQVLAVKLRGSEKRVPISGFPSTLADLQRREKLKWLQ